MPNINLKTVNDNLYFVSREIGGPTSKDNKNFENIIFNSSDFIFKDKKIDKILFIDYEGARIIKTNNININIKNKNTIIVNDKYIYHSIINSNLYRVIFPMFIKY